jgi:glycosyltransferase involved in cell wall biosynthesis
MAGAGMNAIRHWLFGPEVSIVHQFHRPPYGGGNQFLLALRRELRGRGFDVGANRVGRRTRACLFNSFNFEDRQLRPLDGMTGGRVHRVDGPVGTYRGSDHSVDERISVLNLRHADATVFQSRYSLEAHAALGLPFRSPVAIPNAVDPDFFHREGRAAWNPGRRTRLISTSWSDNANKGFATYKWLAENLDRARYEYTFVGRSPLRFEGARMVAAVPSRELGGILRQHDIYVTASLHEACSNGLLEALACGLPALYVESGSNGELVGEGGIGFAAAARGEEIVDGLERLVAAYESRKARIATPSLAEVADRYLAVMGLPPRASPP